jgi:hypothetical protein
MKRASSVRSLGLYRHSLLLAGALWGLAGCATLPVTGTQATGEPVAVDSRLHTFQYTTQEKVGEVQYRDANGNSAGTSTVYADRVHTGQALVWKTYQGQSPLDDEDFFRITGDQATAQEIRESRETGILLNKIGWIGVAVGAAAIVGYLALTRSNDPGVQSAGYGAGTLGSVAAAGGGGLIWWGILKAKAEHPVNDVDRASADAAAYNRKLSRAPAAPGRRTAANSQ